ncbi:hypothetical protein ES708_10983 [subsurface metagenome]
MNSYNPIAIEGDHHIIKVDSIIVFDFSDAEFNKGRVGLRK